MTDAGFRNAHGNKLDKRSMAWRTGRWVVLAEAPTAAEKKRDRPDRILVYAVFAEFDNNVKRERTMMASGRYTQADALRHINDRD